MLFICVGFLGPQICKNLMAFRNIKFLMCSEKYDIAKQCLQPKGCSLISLTLKRLPRFEVKLGRLQIIGDQFRQKMIDVLMSLDITNMSFENQIQHAVLIAGDSDFVPAIKKAKDYGIIVHLYYHPSSVHNEILDEVDELHEINEELIDSCKM